MNGAGVGRNSLTAGGELALEMGKEGDLPLMDSAGAGGGGWRGSDSRNPPCSASQSCVSFNPCCNQRKEVFL